MENFPVTQRRIFSLQFDAWHNIVLAWNRNFFSQFYKQWSRKKHLFLFILQKGNYTYSYSARSSLFSNMAFLFTSFYLHIFTPWYKRWNRRRHSVIFNLRNQRCSLFYIAGSVSFQQRCWVTWTRSFRQTSKWHGKELANDRSLLCISSTGGLKEFCRDYQNLCENAPVNVCHVTDFPPSPTPATTCDSHAGRPQGAPVTAILPLLYLGNEEGAADEALIDRLSIKYILNLTPRCPNFFSQRSDMHYKQIKINDSNQEDIEQHFDEAIQFIGKWWRRNLSSTQFVFFPVDYTTISYSSVRKNRQKNSRNLQRRKRPCTFPDTLCDLRTKQLMRQHKRYLLDYNNRSYRS